MNKSDIFPAMVGFPPATDDVENLPAGTTTLRLVSKAKNFQRLCDFPSLERLWCFDIDDKRMETLSRCQSLRRLYVEGGRTTNIAALLHLKKLEVLSLDSMRGLGTLEILDRFVGLSGLSIENAAKVKSLEPLQSLTNLEALAIAGGMYSPMRVESLKPLQNLKRLQFLSLCNLRVRDESLEPLRGLQQLQSLELPNFYSLREFAQLAACLRNAHCEWFSPWIDCSGSVFYCRKCGESSGSVMLAGGGARILCKNCDAEQLRKHEDSFRKYAGAA